MVNTIPDGDWAFGSRWNDSTDGLCSIKRYVPVESGKTYMVSYNIKHKTGDSGGYIRTSFVGSSDAAEGSNYVYPEYVGTEWQTFETTFTATAATAFSFISGARLSAARVDILHFYMLTKRASAVSVTAAKKIRQAKHKYPPIKPQIRLCLGQLSCPPHTMPFVFNMLISCFAVFANHTLILYIV